MLRAAAAPERFLDRGFAQFLSESTKGRAKARKKSETILLPPDLAKLLHTLNGATLADFLPSLTFGSLTFASLVRASGRNGSSLTRLVCLLASAIPFGETLAKEAIAYFLADGPPARSIIVALGPRKIAKPSLICRGAAELAVMCSLQAADSSVPFEPKPFNIADEEAISSAVDRARTISAILVGTDVQVRMAIRALALKPFDMPPADPPISTRVAKKKKKATKPADRGALVLGPLVEAFFREPNEEELMTHLNDHASSSRDAIVREAATLLASALPKTAKTKKPSKLAVDLGRRRNVALRALSAKTKIPASSSSPTLSLSFTRHIVDRIDALPPNVESFGAIHERDEALLALGKLGDRKAIAPELLARALTGDANAVDMLAALGDASIVSHLDLLLDAEPSRVRLYEASVARMLVAINAREAARPVLRLWLDENPMTGWREGLERGVLVRELVIALGELEDHESAARLLAILESTSQEYRPVLPAAAQALGRLRHAPAITALERLLFSPKDPVTCEAVWAVGAIAQPDATGSAPIRDLATSLLERLTGLEPGAEATRLAALMKLRRSASPTALADVKRAIDRALWEPAFRQEESSRRRMWGLLALEELAALQDRLKGGFDPSMFFLGHEAIRHLVTRDDHRVRRSAEAAFAAWSLPVPKVRMYFSFALVDQSVEMLLEAVRDPLGVFRHNVATRLSEIGDPRSVRPLAEATARLFAEPPTSTYEYDDAPPHLVAFVRALARLNKPESNDVLIDGLRSENHQVRAVIAENAPDDERFVPELMTMLNGDPRSFLRSRAEKSLTSLGAIPQPIEPATTEIAAISPAQIARLVEGGGGS